MQSLKSQPIWVLWKLSDGRKRPFSAITGHETEASKDHLHEWTDYMTAASALAKAELKIAAKRAAIEASSTEATETEATEATNDMAETAANTEVETATTADMKAAEPAETVVKCRRGVGFVIPEGYFFLDVDHQTSDSLLVKELTRLLPTYAEVSPSHNGIHFYGKCDLNRLPIMADKKGTRKLSKEYYVKNPNNGLELYIGGLTNRFSTFTGECISETEDTVDCTDALLRLLDEKMRKYPQLVIDATASGADGSIVGSGADDGFDYNNFIRLGKSDIPKIIYDLEHQKNGAKFKSLYRYGEIPDKETRSEADMTLCALIAFRTGPNVELIDTIFRQSELMRPKWDREDYAASTIEAGIEACHGNFHPAVRKDANLPPFVVVKKGKAKLDVPRLYNHVRQVLPHILVRDSARTDCSIYVYKGAFEFTYDGLFWFAMNRLPKFGGDDGEWVYKRIIPFYCPNPIPDGQKDKDLLEKIFEQEKQAIFNKAMKGLRAVLDNDYTFHEPVESAIIRNNYRIDNNSALDFFHTMMEKREDRARDVSWDDKLTVSKVYKAYKSWYSSMNPSSHYMKKMTDFYNDIADFLGIKYDVMKGKSSRGFCLSEYRLTDEAVKKYAPIVDD